jgi:hypothetical protein
MPWNWAEEGFWSKGIVPAGTHDQAVIDRIQQLEKWMHMSLNPEADQAEIDRLREQLEASGTPIIR